MYVINITITTIGNKNPTTIKINNTWSASRTLSLSRHLRTSQTGEVVPVIRVNPVPPTPVRSTGVNPRVRSDTGKQVWGLRFPSLVSVLESHVTHVT